MEMESGVSSVRPGTEMNSSAAVRRDVTNVLGYIGFFSFFYVDLIIGETTCDGKKKAYEIFDEITKKVYVMELPNKKSDEGRALWTNEIRRLAEKLIEVTGREITLDKLREAARVVNAKRRALQRLSDARAT